MTTLVHQKDREARASCISKKTKGEACVTESRGEECSQDVKNATSRIASTPAAQNDPKLVKRCQRMIKQGTSHMQCTLRLVRAYLQIGPEHEKSMPPQLRKQIQFIENFVFLYSNFQEDVQAADLDAIKKKFREDAQQVRCLVLSLYDYTINCILELHDISDSC